MLDVKTITNELRKYCAATTSAIHISYISGDMKQTEILKTVDQFAAGTVHVLVSTTIVEVGVNVPNATVIAVMNAEHFGLAALHQLRGRVGRKGDQGYCYLVTDILNDKLIAMTKYSSGFKIAEVDMTLRGPGNILGEEQTGESEIISLILRYPKLAYNIRMFFNTKKYE